jgi:hypothetical protein
MPVCLERYGKVGHRLRNAWSQGHVRAACVVMLDPLLQQASQLVLRHQNHTVQTLTPQRPKDAFADGVGLWSPGRHFQHLQSQVAYTALEVLGENTVPVMHQEAVAMV